MANTDISLEPLLNNGLEDGTGAKVTAIAEIGAMTIRTPLTITSTSQEIIITAGKNAIEIQNTGAKNIYIGGSDVTSTNGIIIIPYESKIFSKVKPTFEFYAVCAALETSTLRVGEYA